MTFCIHRSELGTADLVRAADSMVLGVVCVMEFLMFPMIDSDDEVIEDCYNVDKYD